MKIECRNKGTALLMTVFATALFSAIVIGMQELNTMEIQLVRNQLGAAQAFATAEAGLNDAFSQLRNDSAWNSGFSNKAFNAGSYSVTVIGSLPNLTVKSTATSSTGFVAKVEADITVGSSAPYVLRIDTFSVNE